MKISFRQGIVRYQRDPNGGAATFLKKSLNGTAIDLIAFNDPTIVTFAHRGANYLHEEAVTVPRAWTGFRSGVDYWLYIDLDMVTAQRKFAFTTLLPTFGPVAPSNPAIDQHWFDVIAPAMKVWNGTAWIDRARVFVAQYAAGSTIVPTALGSQVNLNTVNDAGFILFDADGYAVRQHQNRKSSEFLTTSSIFNTVTAKAINMTLDALCVQVKAMEPLPAFSMVARDPNGDDGASVRLASSSNTGLYTIGMVQEDFGAEEQGIITQQGYVANEQWNWVDAPGSPLYLGVNGTITTTAPQTGLLQRIGEIVSPRMIYLNIGIATRYVDSHAVDYANIVPVVINKNTGEQMIAPNYDQAGIGIVNELLKDASKLPVTALGGSRKLLEEWTAEFVSIDGDLNRRVKALEEQPEDPIDVDAEYIRNTPMTIAVGGAAVGTTFDGTIQDALDKILYPFGVPKFSTFSIRNSQSVIEVGSTIPGGVRVFDWTTVNPLNIANSSITILDVTSNIVLASELPDTGSASTSIGSDLNSNTPARREWRIAARDTQGGTISKSYTIDWRWKVYYGNNQLESMIGADVAALISSSTPASPAGAYLMPAGGFKWLCYPSSFPTLTSFKDQSTGLNIAINDPVLISVTNQYGLVQTYKCHRTYNKLGSSITIVGS